MSYSREEVKAITDKILNMAKADAVEVDFQGGERSATRYANSSITANLIEHDQQVNITVYYGKKSATTITHSFDGAVPVVSVTALRSAVLLTACSSVIVRPCVSLCESLTTFQSFAPGAPGAGVGVASRISVPSRSSRIAW